MWADQRDAGAALRAQACFHNTLTILVMTNRKLQKSLALLLTAALLAQQGFWVGDAFAQAVTGPEAGASASAGTGAAGSGAAGVSAVSINNLNLNTGNSAGVNAGK